MKRTLLCLGIVLLFSSEQYAQIDSGANGSVKNLYGNLKEVASEKKFLFGQEFFNSFRQKDGLFEDENYSDSKATSGAHPGVLGQDFHYYLYKSSDEKRKHLEAVRKAYSMGCVITFDFHMNSKYGNTTSYTDSDKYLMYNIGEQNNTYGEVTWYNQELDKVISIINNDLKMPIVFRLFHEMNGNWFWWGSRAEGGGGAYKKFYKYTVDYIKARTNWVLYSWSPDKSSGDDYWPGSAYVDVIGLDAYDMDEAGGGTSSQMITDLTKLVDRAQYFDKVAVLSETGNRVKSPDNNPYWWWNSVRTPIVNSDRAWKIAWVLTWINSNWGGIPNVPYAAGSSSTAISAFKDFRNNSATIFQPEAQNRNMYNSASTSKSVLLNDKTNLSEGEQDGLSLFPNPVKDSATISFFANTNEDVSIAAYSISGIQIGNMLLNNSQLGQNKYTLSMKQLNIKLKGTYILKLKVDNKIEYLKLIKIE